MNLAYALLDARIIAGGADEEAWPGTTYAELLEQSAALAGALAAVGVTPGARVVSDVAGDADAVVVALAVARLGAVVVPAGGAHAGSLRTLLDGAAPAVVVVDDPAAVRAAIAAGADRPGTVLVAGEPDHLDERHELAWDVAVRAGRTDPAAATDRSGDAASLLDVAGPQVRVWTVAEHLARLPEPLPVTAAGWREAILGVSDDERAQEL